MLRWKPAIRFFEHRSELLRAFEDAGTLTAFRWRDQALGLRLGPHREIEVRPDGLRIETKSPDLRCVDAGSALSLIFESIVPEQVVFSALSVRSLIAVDGASSAVAAASGRKLAQGLDSEATAVDWAMLLDGTSGSLRAAFQVEYGIVSAEEASTRLSGVRRGRIAALGDEYGPEGPGSLALDLGNIPSTALFADWRWSLEHVLAGRDLSAAVVGLWGRVLDESEHLTAELQRGLGIAVVADEGMEAQG